MFCYDYELSFPAHETVSQYNKEMTTSLKG